MPFIIILSMTLIINNIYLCILNLFDSIKDNEI